MWYFPLAYLQPEKEDKPREYIKASYAPFWLLLYSSCTSMLAEPLPIGRLTFEQLIRPKCHSFLFMFFSFIANPPAQQSNAVRKKQATCPSDHYPSPSYLHEQHAEPSKRAKSSTIHYRIEEVIKKGGEGSKRQSRTKSTASSWRPSRPWWAQRPSWPAARRPSSPRSPPSSRRTTGRPAGPARRP